MNRCMQCSKDTNNPKFCSLSCGAKFQSKGRVLKNRTKVCEGCGIEYEYKSTPSQRFCSHSCSAKLSNKARSRELLCINCNSGEVKKGASKYCSSECSIEYKRKKHIEKWLENPSFGNTSQGLKQSIKSHLIEQAGYKCSMCGWNKINIITGKSPLEVDHIDGDCYNNHKDNLRVLCPNCHSLTPTYKALNKNSKRKYRNINPE